MLECVREILIIILAFLQIEETPIMSIEIPKIDVNASIPGGSTPLHSAADKGKDDVVELLISHGANVNAVTQRFNHSPLFEAVKSYFLVIF